MKYIVAILALSLSGCVAPSITIYGRGTSIDMKGNRKTVAVKEFQAYGDIIGKSSIKGSIVEFSTDGGYYNSPVVEKTYDGIAKVGRATVQPIIWGPVTGAAVGQGIGLANKIIKP